MVLRVWEEPNYPLMNLTANYRMALGKVWVFDTLLNDEEALASLDSRPHKDKVPRATGQIVRLVLFIHDVYVFVETVNDKVSIY